MQKVLYILGQLSDDDIEWMIANGKRRQAQLGTVLIHEGKPIDALYIVLDGISSVSAGTRVRNEIAQLGAGEIVGEMSFVDARPPSATVAALQDSVVLSIDRSRLSAKLEQDTGFATRFYRAVAVFLSHRLRNTESRLLGYGTVQELDEDIEYEDELDLSVLDNLHLAGARFDRMLKRLMES